MNVRRDASLEYISRRRLIRDVVGLMALAGASCHRRTVSGSTVRILYGADERIFAPAADDVPKFLLFLPLVAFESDEDWSCRRPTPGLAADWVHSPDFRTWTMHLRRDVRWHDGVPVTAHDIKFTMDLWRHPDVQHWALGPLESITVLDDYTFRAVYTKPSRQLLDGWSVFYPQHLLKDLDPQQFWKWDFWTRPVGNGPYRYVRRVPNTMMEFEANPDFYRGHPQVEHLIVKFGGGTSLMELLGGSVDAIASISSLDAAKLAQDPRFRVDYHSPPTGVRIFWNHRNPLFREATVRRALTQAINRRGLHGVLSFPGDLPITDGIFTACQFERRQVTEPWPYDPDESRRVLEQAGWRDRDGNGVRRRDGRAFAFTMLALNDWLQAPEAAVFIQDQLRRVGVRMEVQLLSRSTVGELVRAGKFEAAIGTGLFSAEFLAEFFGERSTVGYNNPRVANLIGAATEAMEEEELDRLYAELSPIFHTDMPATFLYPKVDTSAAHRRVGGMDGDWFMNADRLWLEDER